MCAMQETFRYLLADFYHSQHGKATGGKKLTPDAGHRC